MDGAGLAFEDLELLGDKVGVVCEREGGDDFCNAKMTLFWRD